MEPFLAQITVEEMEQLGLGGVAIFAIMMLKDIAMHFLKARVSAFGPASSGSTSCAAAGAMSEVRNLHQANNAEHAKTQAAITEVATATATHAAEETAVMRGVQKALEDGSESTRKLHFWLAENVRK